MTRLSDHVSTGLGKNKKYMVGKFCSGAKVSEEWKEKFPMLHESFEKISGDLRLYIQKNFTRFRGPVSMEKKVVATL